MAVAILFFSKLKVNIKVDSGSPEGVAHAVELFFEGLVDPQKRIDWVIPLLEMLEKPREAGMEKGMLELFSEEAKKILESLGNIS